MQLSDGRARRRLQIWSLGEKQSEVPNKASSKKDVAVAPAGVAPDVQEVDDEAYEAAARALSEAPQPIELDGICQMPNGFDRSCRTKTIGPQSVDVVYQDALDKTDKRRQLDEGLLSATVHIDLEEVGKFHGVLTAQTIDGFHVAVDPKFSGLLLAKLARYIARGLPQQQENRGGVGVPQPSERIVPKTAFCTYRDQHGVFYKGSLINVSRVDAMIKARTLPELNSLITFCGRRPRRAHVIRRLETGFAALFVDPLAEQEFSADILLTDEFPGLR
jgi:hypothetical protein